MQFSNSGDELWDEHQWDAHISEVEKKSDQLRKFITADPKGGSTPRWITLLEESLSEDDAFEAYVEEELLLDEAYFPDDDDWEDEDDFEDDDDEFPYHSYDEFNEDASGFEEGEEWKALSEDFAYSDYGSLDNLRIYSRSKNLAVDILRWAIRVNRKYHRPEIDDFVDETLKIAAKLAGGYSFGFEHEYMGANIAYTKRALYYANNGLKQMSHLKGSRLFKKAEYLDFNERFFELRNDIGVYVQELRDRFQKGLD